MGDIVSYMSETNKSQATWDATFHQPEDCNGAKRLEGCLVCSHMTDSCVINNCGLCQARQGLPFDSGINWQFPKN